MAERKKIQKVNPKGAVKKPSPKQPTESTRNVRSSDSPKVREPAKSTKSRPSKPIKMMPQANDKFANQKNRQATPPSRPSKRAASPKNTARTPQNTVRKGAKGSKPWNTGIDLESGLMVILGRKTETRRKRLITAFIAFVVIMSLFIFWVTSPTGPIERITNTFTVMGGGKFPSAISGNDVLALQIEGDKAFLLTNSHLSGYNSSGKEFIDFQHNFSNPVLKTSAARTLVFNRESTGFIIANNTDVIFEQNLEKAIFCADIAYNGSVAFVTDSPSYSAQILVFNKGMKQYFSWYLADGLISDITLSNDGDKLAVAVLKVKNGEFCTVIYCLDTDKEQPIFEKEISGESVVKLETVSSKKFAYVSNKGSAFVEWKNGLVTDDSPKAGAPSFVTSLNNGLLISYGETANSQIVRYKPSGVKKSQLEYNGLIDCISAFDKYVYILSGNQVHVLNHLGEKVNTIALNQKPKYIAGIKGGVLAVDNMNISFYSAVTQK